MRVTIFSLAIIAAGLLGATQTASAQTAENYPWCFIESSEGHHSCYFQTREQCVATLTGIEGNCYPNWNYQPLPGGLPPAVVDRTARTVESYKWCSVRTNDGAKDCYYDTLEDCNTTSNAVNVNGFSGACYPSPYYRPAAAPAPRGRVVAKKRSSERNDR